MTTAPAPTPRLTGDFDFLVGSWAITNRRLHDPLSGSDRWYETPADAHSRTHFNGAVSIDEMFFPLLGFSGMSIRLYEPATNEWTIYWVNSQTGTMQAPVRGSWSGGVLEAFGDDEFGGRPIRARYRWSEISETSATWEQAFSADGGENWETNWVMHWTRIP
jgi:hypothetical protein